MKLIKYKDISNKIETYFYTIITVLVFFGFFSLIISGRDYFVVIEVIDGDTVILENKKDNVRKSYRLLGINTPEIKKKGYGNSINECYGMEAKDFLTEYVYGKRVFIEYDKVSKDIYERELVFMYLGDVNISFELLRKGMAKALIIKPNVKYSKTIRELENIAKTRSVGMWDKCN